LNIEKETLENQQVKLTVEVDNELLEESKRKAAKKIARRIKVPGFRPGKAPYQVIRRQIGDEALLEESLEILVNDIYPKIIQQSELDPYGPGNLENVVSLDPITLEFIVPLMPEVEIADYKSIRIPYEPPEISDDDIDAVVQDFRQRQASEETAQRPAETGDHVYIRLSAKRFEDSEEGVEDDSAPLIQERSTSMLIPADDADTTNEWPFGGFSRELIGMAAGEDKTLVYTYPADSPYETLREVNAEFSVHVEDVKARVLPELNDEFAQSLGEYEDLAALKQDISESLEQRALSEYNTDYDDQVLEQVIENSTIKFPPQMKENEISNVVQQLEGRLANQGLDMDIYLKTRELDEQGLRDEAEPVAETRVKRSLVLLEIARQEEIDVSEAELQDETTRTLDSITQFMSENDRKRFDSPEALINLTGNIYAEMRMNRTIEYLRNIANGQSEAADEPEDETTDAEEIIASQESEVTSKEESAAQLEDEKLDAGESPEEQDSTIEPEGDESDSPDAVEPEDSID
jgi:trigger factor